MARRNREGSGLPLDGIRVVDFTELLPGPFLTHNLLELGADVVKIERPLVGDALQRSNPTLYSVLNEHKECIQLDLRNPADHKKAKEHILHADVLIEGYRPGVMARHGLDYCSLKTSCPRLIYVSLTGYGQTGPDAKLPGHDINYLACSGVLALSGDPLGEPMPGAGVPVADLCGAMYGMSGLLTALFQRERTGRGQYLDVAITEAVTHWMISRAFTLQPSQIQDFTGRRQFFIRPAYGAFKSRDGRYLSIAALEDHFWVRLLSVIDIGPYATPVYARMAVRREHATEINEALAQAVLKWDGETLARRLREADVPVMLMFEFDQLPALAQHSSRGLFMDTAHGPVCRFPVRLEGMGAGRRS